MDSKENSPKPPDSSPPRSRSSSCSSTSAPYFSDQNVLQKPKIPLILRSSSASSSTSGQRFEDRCGTSAASSSSAGAGRRKSSILKKKQDDFHSSGSGATVSFELDHSPPITRTKSSDSNLSYESETGYWSCGDHGSRTSLSSSSSAGGGILKNSRGSNSDNKSILKQRRASLGNPSVSNSEASGLHSILKRKLSYDSSVLLQDSSATSDHNSSLHSLSTHSLPSTGTSPEPKPILKKKSSTEELDDFNDPTSTMSTPSKPILKKRSNDSRNHSDRNHHRKSRDDGSTNHSEHIKPILKKPHSYEMSYHDPDERATTSASSTGKGILKRPAAASWYSSWSNDSDGESSAVFETEACGIGLNFNSDFAGASSNASRSDRDGANQSRLSSSLTERKGSTTSCEVSHNRATTSTSIAHHHQSQQSTNTNRQQNTSSNGLIPSDDTHKNNNNLSISTENITTMEGVRSESEEDIIMGLSVAEKRSLFMQMERESLTSIDNKGKGNIGSSSRKRNDKRFVTQPVTTVEVAAAQLMSTPSTSSTLATEEKISSKLPKPLSSNTALRKDKLLSSMLGEISDAHSKPQNVLPAKSKLEPTNQSKSFDNVEVERQDVKAHLPIQGSLPRSSTDEVLEPSKLSIKDRVRMFNGFSSNNNNNSSAYKLMVKRSVTSKRFCTQPVTNFEHVSLFNNHSSRITCFEEDVKRRRDDDDDSHLILQDEMNKLSLRRNQGQEDQVIEQVELLGTQNEVTSSSSCNTSPSSSFVGTIINNSATSCSSFGGTDAAAAAALVVEVQGQSKKKTQFDSSTVLSINNKNTSSSSRETENFDQLDSSSRQKNTSSIMVRKSDNIVGVEQLPRSSSDEIVESSSTLGFQQCCASKQGQLRRPSDFELSTNHHIINNTPEGEEEAPIMDTKEKIVSFVKKQLLGRSSSCNFPKMELEIHYDQQEKKPSRISEKIAALKTNGEINWLKRLPPKKTENLENILLPVGQNENDNRNNKEFSSSVVANRLSLLEKSQDGWKKRISESDATNFTVQGRLEKAGKIVSNGTNLTKKEFAERKSRIVLSKSQHQFPTNQSLTVSSNRNIEKSSTTCVVDGGGGGDSNGELAHKIKISPKKSPVVARFESSSSSDSNVEEEVVVRSVVQNDNETFSQFFSSPLATKSYVSSSPAVIIDDSSFSSIISSSSNRGEMLGLRRNLKLNRKHGNASRNPIKTLASRMSGVEQSYVEVAPEIREKELKKRVQIENLSKTSHLSIEALAGLASKEDFTAVKLKRAAAKTNQEFPYPMLIRIKGKRFVQTRLVNPQVASLNSGDCFVLVTGNDKVYQYIGEFSNRMEKSKLADVVTFITQKKDLGCRSSSTICTIEEPHVELQTVAYQALLSALGGGVIKSDEDLLGDEHDEAYESGVIRTNRVFQVDPVKEELSPLLDAGGWGSQPRHSMLKDSQVLVFDFGSEMYVWSGSKSDPSLKRLGSRLAKEMFDDGYSFSQVENEFSPLSETKRPSWCWFKRVNQLMEPVLFREKFFDWPDDDSGRIKTQQQRKSLGSECEKDPSFNFQACDINEMLESYTGLDEAGLELQGFNVGRGREVRDEKERRSYVITTDHVHSWHISEFSLTKLDKSKIPHFYSSETYVVRWSYIVTQTGRDLKGNVSKQGGAIGRQRTAYFFWHGNESSITEKGTSALMTVELDSEKGPQIRVVQGTEPPAFLNLFKGLMFIHSGSPDECSRRSRRLYVTMGGSEEEGHFVEVASKPSSFRSKSSFLYLDLTNKCIFVWHGACAHASSRKIADSAAKHLSSGQDEGFQILKNARVITVEEGEETQPFLDSAQITNIMKWRESYASFSGRPTSLDSEIHFFRFTSLHGAIEAIPIPSPRRKSGVHDPFPILQEELYSAQQPSLFLISTNDETWLWQGWLQLNEEENSATGSREFRWAAERRAAIETAVSYSKHRKSEGFLVHAGLEPALFRALFPYWNINEEARETNISEGKLPEACVQLSAALQTFQKSTYTVEELQARPEGVDVLKLENYLSDDDFQDLLKMSREDFAKLQSWKKTELKKQAGLF